jgi:hypothetical protein
VLLRVRNRVAIVVETVRTVKNILDHWRIESIILFLYVDLEKLMIASTAYVRDVYHRRVREFYNK